jgi:hypothetical protein
MFEAGLGIVRDRDLGHTIKEFQGADMGVDPTSQFLAAARFGEGVIAGAEDGDKQRCLEIDLACEPIINGNLVTGVVDEQPFSGPVFLPEDHIEVLLPLAIQLTKTAIAIAIGVLLAILFPDQLECKVVMGLQLLADRGEVRQVGLAPPLGGPRRTADHRLQPPIIPIGRQRPAYAGGRGCFQIPMNCALGNSTTASNLLLFQPQRRKAKNFFELTHAEPCLRQSEPPPFSGSPLSPAQPR